MIDTSLVIAGVLLAVLPVRWGIGAWLIKRDAQRRREEMRRHVK
jgi:hypothetical protein